MSQDQPVPEDASPDAGQQSRSLPEADPIYLDPQDPSLHRDGPVLRLLSWCLMAGVLVAIVCWRSCSSGIEIEASPLGPFSRVEAERWELPTAVRVLGEQQPEIIYSLDGEGLDGCDIDPKTGLITWTPSEEQGPGKYELKVVVRVGSVPEPVVRIVEVTVDEANLPPVISSVESQQVKVGKKLSVTVLAKDPDIPKNDLKFRLVGESPTGARISPETGVFTWTPPREMSPGSYKVTIAVTDGGKPPLEDKTTFEVQVKPPPPPLENHFVFLVGVSGYRPRVGLHSLKFPERDIEELAEVLIDRGVPEKNIFVMSASRAAKEYRFLPIAKHISQELVQWLKSRKPGDRIILGFSGHGVQIGDVAYFCPADIDLRKPETLISFAKIYELLKQCPASVKLLVTDACRTNPFDAKTRDIVPGLDSVTRPQAIPLPGGIAALFACATGQVAFEDRKLGEGKMSGHGVFFRFLIEAFKGAADADKDKKLTITELHTYVAGKVEAYVSEKFGEKQTPTLKATLVGSSVILDGSPRRGKAPSGAK